MKRWLRTAIVAAALTVTTMAVPETGHAAAFWWVPFTVFKAWHWLDQEAQKRGCIFYRNGVRYIDMQCMTR